MSRGRLAVIGVALGLIASQAGHLLAYQIRYGTAAERLQSTGAHTYFPALVKTGIGLTAAFVLLALIAIGFARLAAGRKVAADPAPSFLRLVALLFCLQLTCFVVQETIEMAAGAPATSAPSLLLWGTAGQLPVALLARPGAVLAGRAPPAGDGAPARSRPAGASIRPAFNRGRGLAGRHGPDRVPAPHRRFQSERTSFLSRDIAFVSSRIT